MAGDTKKPNLALALSILVFFAGGFLLLVKMSVDARNDGALTAGFGSRTAPEAAAKAKAGGSLADRLKAGIRAAESKLDDWAGGLFGWGGGDPAAGGQYTASRDGASGGDGGDSFEQYYKKNYASGESDGWNTDSWEEPAGGGGFSAAGGGSDYGGSTYSPRKGGKAVSDDGWADPAMKRAGLAPKKGQDAGKGAAAAAADQPKLFASAAGGFSQLNTGGPQATSTSQNWGAKRGASQTGGAKKALEGMRGGASAADLGGAAVRSKSGGMSDFSAKMSGGAGAVKGDSAGSSVPSASKPSDKSSGSSGGSGDPGAGAAAPSGSSSDKADDKTAAKTSPSADRTQTDVSSDDDDDDAAASTEATFLASVVKKYGTGAKVTDENGKSVTGQPEEALLKERGMAAPKEELLASAKRGVAAVKTSEPEPEDFSQLPAARKQQLQKRMMTFLKRVQNNYGEKQTIEAKTCAQDSITCNNHGLTLGYIDMVTQQQTEAKVSYKYSDGKWRMYMVDFSAPESLRRMNKQKAAAAQ